MRAPIEVYGHVFVIKKGRLVSERYATERRRKIRVPFVFAEIVVSI